MLRHFGGTKRRAVEVYKRDVDAALGQKSQDEYYSAAEGRLLGTEEFLKKVKHRVGEHRALRKDFTPISAEELLGAAEKASGLSRAELCSKSKNRRTVAVKEAVIVVGRQSGILNRDLAEALGVDPSAVTKRVEAARIRGEKNPEIAKLQKRLKRSASVR